MNDDVSIKSYIDTVFQEKERALEVASEERGRTAEAVRTALEAQILQGDVSLERHITDQIESVKAALESQNKLRVADLTRIEQGAVAAQLAIDKAEQAIQRRLDLLNEFRAQSVDEGKKYSLREVTDQQLGDLKTRLDKLEGGKAERKDIGERVQPWMIWAAGALLIIVVFVANFLAGSGP